MVERYRKSKAGPEPTQGKPLPKALRHIFGKEMPPEPPPEAVNERLWELTGALNSSVQCSLIRMALRTQLEEDPDFPIGSVVAAFAELRPQDLADGLICVQVFQAHSKAQECFRRAFEPNRTLEEINMYLTHGARLTRLELECIEHLDKRRGGEVRRHVPSQPPPKVKIQ
jgi:hypothetical protein